MKNIFVIIFIFFLISCSKKEDPIRDIPKNPLYQELQGKYETNAILINNPVDINRDGIYSNNLLQEFEHAITSSKNRLEIKSNELLNLELLTISFPYSSEENFIDGKFYSDWVILGGEYEIDDNKLISEDTILSSITLLDNKTIGVKGEIELYTSEGWEMIEFSAVYEKR
ncbi:MAG: hypothetical protein COZ18_12765 [Flexibacter sp. CG_4_10_14_3_um_filter_32_15]|nr:MAG: hypothetical protein COZ18_12765 [Flexibacter sp. CG_4_10_14_3_um_filter_32_15]